MGNTSGWIFYHELRAGGGLPNACRKARVCSPADLPAKVLRVRSPEVRVSALAAARRKARSPEVFGPPRERFDKIDVQIIVLIFQV